MPPAWGHTAKGCQTHNCPFSPVLPPLQGEQSQEQVLGWMKREMVAKANEIKVSLFCFWAHPALAHLSKCRGSLMGTDAVENQAASISHH